MFVNRLEVRAKKRKEVAKEEIFTSIYDVIEKISDEVVISHRDLISDITESKASQSALELVVLKIINKKNYRVKNVSRKELIEKVIAHILGYGMVQPYLDKEGCNGVFINGPNNAWVKIGKKIEPAPDIKFGTNENLRSYIRTTIQANLKGEINEDKALAKFEDPVQKLRIICGIEPVAHISPFVVFRKHKSEAFTLDDLVEMDMLPRELADDLVRYARAGANIVFSGRGGAGKTTLLRALIEELKEEIRILLMEENAEIFPKHRNVNPLLVKRNTKGQAYGIQEITDMGLLMSIDVYVFGEIRGGEAMHFFDGAYNGNITWNTSHAGSAKKTLKKLMINMKKSGTNLSEDTLMDMLYESVNIIVFLDSFTVSEVIEVVPEAKEKYNTLWNFEVHNREVTFIQGKHKRVGKLKSEDLIRKMMESNLLREEDLDGEIEPADHRIIHFDRSVFSDN